MADNTTLNTGIGGDVISTDDLGSVKVQRVKVQYGVDGVATDVSDTNPLPIDDAGGSITVDGTVELGATSLAALENVGATVTGTVELGATSLAALETVSVTDGGGSLTVDGTVELGATSLAALETIELGATTLAALETITVNVSNTPNTTPILASIHDGTTKASVADLTNANPLHVAIVDSAGNQVTSFGGSGGTSATDDSAFTAASGSGTPMMAFATADSVDSGDVGVVAMTTARALHVAVQGTAAVSDGGGSLTVDGTVELGATTLAALESITVVDGGSTISIDDGAGSITVDGTVELGATSLAALESLTTINAVTTVGTITNAVTVVGSAAEDAAASGNPVLIGGRYDSSARTLETGDVGAIALNASGQVLVEIAAGAGSGGTSAADGATFTRNTTSITPVGAVVETSAPTLTNGDVAGLSQTTGGALRVAVTSGGVAGILEDAASAGGEEGIMMLAVRRDSASSGVSADGDFAALSVTSDGSLRVSGGGGGTQYAVDTAGGGTDTGTLSLAVRDDALATLTPVDGDYTQLRTNARGAQWVALDSTVAQTVTLAAGTATNEVVGDAAHDAAAAGNPLLQGGYASAAAPTDVSADADVVRAWYLRNGAQATVLTAAGALIGGDATNGLDVDVTRVIPGTSATHLGKAEDAPHASGDTGVMSLGVRSDTAAASSGTTGDYEPFHTDSVGAMWTRSTGELADDAAFTPGTSRVMPMAYFADDTSTDSVDEGDAGMARMTLNRKQIAQPYESEANTWSYAAAAGGLVNTTGVTAKAAAGAGLRNYITSIQVINSHQTTGTEVVVRDGAAGTVIHRGWAAANSGYAATFPVALRGTANTLVEIAEVTTTATAGVLVNLQGYIGA